MRIECYGKGIPKDLSQSARKCGHTLVSVSKTPVDGMIIAGNARKDIAYAKKALESGIPVFCSAPTATINQTEAIMKVALDTRSVFYLPYHRRLSPAYSAITSQVDAGKVGKVGFIKIHSNLPVPKNYTTDRARPCSTLVLAEMIHDIDWLNMHFGPIRTVFCQGTQKNKPATEYAMASFTLKNGVIAQVIHSYQSKVDASLRVEVCGMEGIVQYDNTQMPIRQTSGTGSAESITDGSRDRWAQHWAAFEELMIKGKPSKKQTRDYIDPIRIADLTIQSILSGDPKKV